MILKNWHEFENKLIVEVNDSFITKNGKALNVVQIYLDRDTLEVSFFLSGGKKITEESIYKNLKSKKYKHKSHSGFIAKLFGGRGDMYQNEAEATKLIMAKVKKNQAKKIDGYLNNKIKINSLEDTDDSSPSSDQPELQIEEVFSIVRHVEFSALFTGRGSSKYSDSGLGDSINTGLCIGKRSDGLYFIYFGWTSFFAMDGIPVGRQEVLDNPISVQFYNSWEEVINGCMRTAEEKLGIINWVPSNGISF